MPAPNKRLLDALIVLLPCSIYTLGYFYWYSLTPLGLVPVLDGREIIELAQAMAGGSLIGEPFYRAPLYPFILSLLLQVGLAPEDLPLASRLLNAVLHLANAWLGYMISRSLWQSRAAGIVAGLLLGLNPVLLHFASDPLDITLALSWLLLGIACALKTIPTERPQVGFVLLAGLAFTLGGYTRPHLLTLALAWPLVWLIKRPRHASLALAPLLAGMVCFGAINLVRSGSFTLLPTQGAYNLWTANKPKANGKYFVQTLDVSQRGTHENSAQTESRLLFAYETGQPASTPQAKQNQHWRGKFIGYVSSEPLAWLGLMSRKAYFLINDFEQYNNKTYAFHKARSPWLVWNPIGWTLILTLATYAALKYYRLPEVRLILFFIVVYAAGFLLFYTSARFRLPLAPLLIILGSGCVSPLFSSSGGKPGLSKLLAGVIALAVGAFSLSPLLGARDTGTYAEDALLLAQASSALKRDTETRHWAKETLARRPDSAAAKELLALSQYNLWLIGAEPAPDRQSLLKELANLDSYPSRGRRLLWLQGLYRYKIGQSTAAKQTWLSLLDQRDELAQDSLAMLMLTDLAEIKVEQLPPLAERTALLRLAAKLENKSEPERASLRFLTEVIPQDQP